MSTPADAPTEPGGDAWFDGEQGIALGARMGRYELVSIVGHGGMGVVFEARDPDLDRTIAVKVLRARGPGSEGELRLRREGMTMARLTHPNVIRVYDVGVAHRHVFVAMEFVAGGTLADWLATQPRTPSEILAVFVQAGRGLAAAHDAGLVHRDFKPANVMVAPDGRVLVTDFGLARDSGEVPEPARTSGSMAAYVDVTTTGQFVGTPAYMAPEQYTSAKVDARADQFSFCVALWRALYGSPPYGGTTIEEIVTATKRGVLVAPPQATAGRVAPRVRAALERGLHADPSLRHPSMTDLLAAIEPRPSRAKAWIVAGAGGAVVVGAVAFGVIAMRSDRDPCPAPTRQVAAVWSPARAQALRGHMTTVDPTTGAQRYAAAAARLDAEVPKWSAMHVAACRATRVDGKQSDATLDARIRCLDGWLDDVDGLAGGLEHAADPAALAAAIKGVGAIEPLADCANANRLESARLPPEPNQRVEAIAIIAAVDELATKLRAGTLDGLAASADALIARARALDTPAALTRALAIRWRIATAIGDIPGALGFLRELTEVAARGHDDEEATKAWAMMARYTAYSGQPDDAKVMIASAKSSLARYGDAPALEAEVLADEADVLTASSETDAALAALAKAKQILVELGADRPGSPYAATYAGVLMSLGETYFYAGDLDHALPASRDAIAAWERLYGPDTVEVASSKMDLAQVLRDREEYAEAEQVARDGVRIRELREGESPALAMALMTLGDIYELTDRVPDAVAAGERALQIATATMPADDMQVRMITLGVASYYDDAGRTAEAVAMYDPIIAAFEHDGVQNANLPTFYERRADMQRRLGKYQESLDDYARSLDAGQKLDGETSTAIAPALRGQAECLHQLHRDREAIAKLERAAKYPIVQQAADDEALGNGLYGMLLVDTGRDRARGLELARAAAAALAASNSDDERRARLDAWLAKHAK